MSLSRLLRFFAAAALLLVHFPAFADEPYEKILSYLSNIKIASDGSMEVTETIRVVALGAEINHGIYRDFPTDYRTPWDFRKTAGFKILQVLKDGRPEPYHTAGMENGTRVYIGQKEVTIPPGVYTYAIHYKTDRQLGFFADHDELYWNVTGNGWKFPIDEVSATVALPSGVTRDRIRVEGYTGLQGSKDRNLEARVEAGGKSVFRTTAPLGSYEGLTIVTSWPKGVVRAPSRFEEWEVFLKDNRMLVVGVFGLLAILAYYLVVWFMVGRDPEKGTIIPLYEAPDKLSPAAVRFIWKMDYDDKALASSIIHLAVQKCLKIEDKDGTYTLRRRTGGEGAALNEEARLLQNLLGAQEILDLKLLNRGVIVGAVETLKKDLKARFEKVYFLTNRSYFIAGIAVTLFALLGSIGAGDATAVATGGFMAIWLSGWSVGTFFLVCQAVAAWRAVASERGVLGKSFSTFGALFTTAFTLPFLAGEVAGLYMFGKGTSVWMLGILLIAVFLNLLFFSLLKAPTRLGRTILDKIEGFRMYLVVAEKDRLTPELFEKFLAYALALDVEQEWAEQFSDLLTEAGRPGGASNYSPAWFAGTSVLTAAAFATSIGGALSSSIASASVSPSSRSGSGGGGSSGGGGGGGGGGGW